MATFTSGLLPDATGQRPLLVREPYTQHEERLMIAVRSPMVMETLLEQTVEILMGIRER